jgi:hypothetical protein
MTYSIGKVPVSSIQNIEVSSSQEQSEVDLIDEDTNFLFLGAESAEDINIDFTLYEDGTSSRTIEEQREELKQLIKEEDINNTFNFFGKKGRISVEDVSFPQDSSQSNIISGSITGQFLPWPKHFPDNTPTFIAFLSGDAYSSLNLDNDRASLIAGIEGSLDSTLDSEADLLVINLLEGKIESTLGSEADLLVINLLGGELDSSFELDNARAGLITGIEGILDSGLNTNGSFSVEKILDGNVESLLSSSSDLKAEKLLDGDFDSVLSSSSDLKAEKLLDGDVNSVLSSESDLEVEKILDGNVESSLLTADGREFGSEEYGDSTYGYTNPILSMFVSLESEIKGSLSIKSSLYGYNYGTNYESSEPILSMYISAEGSLDSQLESNGDLRLLNEIGYGNDYGNDYGGLIEGYGSDVYNRGTYAG